MSPDRGSEADWTVFFFAPQVPMQTKYRMQDNMVFSSRHALIATGCVVIDPDLDIFEVGGLCGLHHKTR